MITGVLGLPGSGKTLYLLWVMQQYVKAGRQVFTNIRLNPTCPFYDRVALLDDGDGDTPPKYPVFQEPDKETNTPYRAFWHYVPRGAVLIFDELDNYFDSMDFVGLRKVSREVHLYWKQHRKFHHDVVYTCQNAANLFVRIRRQTQNWVVCESDLRRLPAFLRAWLPKRWLRFRRGVFNSEKKPTASGSFGWSEGARMFGWYETEQILGAGMTGVTI